MQIQKELSDIALNITEPEYRERPELSYSTLATYEREGFNNLEHLFDKKESPSLLFGSCVDTLLTDGKEAYDNAYMVAEFPSISDKEKLIVTSLFNNYNDTYDNISKIPTSIIIDTCMVNSYQSNWRPETRAKVIIEHCSDYYNLMYLAKGKQLISTELNDKVLKTVDALRTSEATRWYFAPDNPFDGIKRYYQLKFAFEHNGVGYRSMADLIIVDYANKVVIPCDLKTSSHTEWDFYKSFIQWRYDIQARLYWRNIRANMDKDEYFKDFKLEDYRFIVCNSTTLTPLVWKCDFTQAVGTLTFGKNNQIELRDPYDIGEELSYYLKQQPKVPIGVNIDKENDLREWLNKL